MQYQRILGGAFAVAVTLVSAARAQQTLLPRDDMTDGRWHGWIQQGDLDSIRVSYTIQHYDHHILINLEGRNGINYDMAGVKVKDDVLSFDWATSSTASMHCRLSRRDGASFEGICDDRSPGEAGKPVHLWMSMVPPARGAGNGS